MAKYFQVKYFDSDKEYGLLPNNSIKKEYLDKVNYDEKRPRFVGNFGWITPNKKLADGYLFNLSDYDKNYVKDVKLKPNEKIFRYFNERTAISGASIIVKLNLEKGLIYFLSEEGSEKDEPIFEGRGYPARWINIVKDKMAKGGKLSDEQKRRYEELSEKVKDMLNGGNRLTSKELAEYSKLKFEKNMAESPLFRKQMEHEAKIERHYKMAKGGSIKVGDKVRSTVYKDISGEVISKKGEMLMVVGKNKNNPSKVSHEVLNIKEVEKMAKGGNLSGFNYSIGGL